MFSFLAPHRTPRGFLSHDTRRSHEGSALRAHIFRVRCGWCVPRCGWCVARRNDQILSADRNLARTLERTLEHLPSAHVEKTAFICRRAFSQISSARRAAFSPDFPLRRCRLKNRCFCSLCPAARHARGGRRWRTSAFGNLGRHHLPSCCLSPRARDYAVADSHLPRARGPQSSSLTHSRTSCSQRRLRCQRRLRSHINLRHIPAFIKQFGLGTYGDLGRTCAIVHHRAANGHHHNGDIHPSAPPDTSEFSPRGVWCGVSEEAHTKAEASNGPTPFGAAASNAGPSSSMDNTDVNVPPLLLLLSLLRPIPIKERHTIRRAFCGALVFFISQVSVLANSQLTHRHLTATPPLSHHYLKTTSQLLPPTTGTTTTAHHKKQRRRCSSSLRNQRPGL